VRHLHKLAARNIIIQGTSLSVIFTVTPWEDYVPDISDCTKFHPVVSGRVTAAYGMESIVFTVRENEGNGYGIFERG
jgi:hypothetical protein